MNTLLPLSCPGHPLRMPRVFVLLVNLPFMYCTGLISETRFVPFVDCKDLNGSEFPRIIWMDMLFDPAVGKINV